MQKLNRKIRQKILALDGMPHEAKRPGMRIGPISLERPYILAPLAGYTDLPFRLLCREMGAALCFSEMISCHGLVHAQAKTLALLESTEDERPVGMQIFGHDPGLMGEAAAIISTRPVDLIDINMGCPVRKVVKKGSGAALMKDFDLAAAIIEKVVASTPLPVTVKFRSGWDSDHIVAADFAEMAAQAGAAALTVHPRTRSQAFGGKADWRIIAEVKERVAVPVIGNGDILTYQDGQDMLHQTGCDGVMIGRGALGNPWIFTAEGRPSSWQARMKVLLRHLELACRFLPRATMLFRMKNHACRYLSGLPGAAAMRRQIMACTDIGQLRTLCLQTGVAHSTDRRPAMAPGHPEIQGA